MIGFTVTINPGDRAATEEASRRGIEVCYLISELVAKNHDTTAARGNWYVNIKTRDRGTVNLCCLFYKRKYEELVEDKDDAITAKVTEWMDKINEHPERWESKWRG